MFEANVKAFIFFWSLRKSFNRVVRTSLHVFKVTFWRNMFLWGQMIKSDFVEVFGLFPKNFRKLTKKVFGRVVKKNFYVFKLTFLWQKHVFLKKIKFVSILALWAKIFTFWKITCNQLSQNNILSVQSNFLSIFLLETKIKLFISFPNCFPKIERTSLKDEPILQSLYQKRTHPEDDTTSINYWWR